MNSQHVQHDEVGPLLFRSTLPELVFRDSLSFLPPKEHFHT